MSELRHRHSLTARANLTRRVEWDGAWTAIAASLISAAGLVVGRTWLVWRRRSLLLGAHLRRRLAPDT
jgi:hypothetical protein